MKAASLQVSRQHLAADMSRRGHQQAACSASATGLTDQSAELDSCESAGIWAAAHHCARAHPSAGPDRFPSRLACVPLLVGLTALPAVLLSAKQACVLLSAARQCACWLALRVQSAMSGPCPLGFYPQDVCCCRSLRSTGACSVWGSRRSGDDWLTSGAHPWKSGASSAHSQPSTSCMAWKGQATALVYGRAVLQLLWWGTCAACRAAVAALQQALSTSIPSAFGLTVDCTAGECSTCPSSLSGQQAC